MIAVTSTGKRAARACESFVAKMLLVFTLFIGTIWGAVTIPYSKVGYARMSHLSQCFADIRSLLVYPDWAHSHWVWLVAADDNAANVRAMLKGYQSRNV